MIKKEYSCNLCQMKDTNKLIGLFYGYEPEFKRNTWSQKKYEETIYHICINCLHDLVMIQDERNCQTL